MRGESDGVLSHSSLPRFSGWVAERTLPDGSPYTPSQCSPSKGSSARISAHVRVGGAGGGFAIASRYVFAISTVPSDGGRPSASWSSMSCKLTIFIH